MIASGASIKAVQRALGHASGKVTLDIYGGLFEEDLEAGGTACTIPRVSPGQRTKTVGLKNRRSTDRRRP